MALMNQTEGRPIPADHKDECNIPRSTLLRVFQGVAVATKTLDENAKPVFLWISTCRIPLDATDLSMSTDKTYLEDAAPTDTFPLYDWRAAIVSSFNDEKDEDSRQLANLALAVAFLREKSRSPVQGAVAAADLSLVWGLIHNALTSLRLSRPLYSASRSAQGFLTVPLCSLVKDGNIDELFRLHVWLPNGQHGDADFAIHSHQPFTRSWILAGEGRNHSYEVVAANSGHDVATATHAEFAPQWKDTQDHQGRNYVTHRTSSVVVNTGRLVRATLTTSAVYSRDMTYSIPAASFHRTEASPEILHATLFSFDSHLGFVKDAYVIGPKEAESSTQVRDPAGVTPSALASIVDAMRLWEVFMGQGRQHAQHAEWEHALQAFNSALNMCESTENFPNAIYYRRIVLGELGNTNRRFGRYEQAKDKLEEALAGMGPSSQGIELSGELGVVYRHMNRLVDAKRALEIQYGTAKQLGFERAMCRAVGNLGMVNYQLSQQNHDTALLDLAIEQLVERVQSSRQIKETIDHHAIDPKTRTQWLRDAKIWESIGLSRLSLCYSACGKAKEAVAAALDSFNLTSTSDDPTIVAMTHLFYGRALLLDGQRTLALQHFNPPHASCTPAIALCKEPSDEHRHYLQEIIAAGADLDLTDEQGYTALDYAVFSADTAMQEIVLNGLRQALDGDVETKLAVRLAEAKVKKGYREVFQEKLRPVLLSLGGGASSGVASGASDGLQSLRRVYVDALAAHEELRSIFDELKAVRYSDFLRFGRLPRSSDGLARRFMSGVDDGERDEAGNQSGKGNVTDFVIFISYRWINKDKGVSAPDDKENTQYGRVVEAVEGFLKERPGVRREGVGLWLDHACINQDDPTPGVTALPMLLTQCDAVISLVDDAYYDRAWCSVEIMMVQTLRKSYGLHMWVVQVEQGDQVNPGEEQNEKNKWILRDGPMDLEINMAEKQLTFEDDRPKVLFLERQTKLLA